MANLRNRSSRVRTQGRKTAWIEGPGTFTDNGVSAGTGNYVMGLGSQALADGLTLVRTRGVVELVLGSNGAAGDGFTGAVGVGLVTAQAFAAGAAAMPTPVAEIEWSGWLWHEQFSLRAGVAADSSRPHLNLKIDSKAMRKLGVEEVLFMSVEITLIGAATMEVTGGCRMLIKLP